MQLFQKEQNKVWFGRDYFGRRSLLVSAEKGTFYLSSVAILDKVVSVITFSLR